MLTKSENSEIAVLQNEMGNIKDIVKRIEHKLDSQVMTYVPREEFIAFKKQWWLTHTMTALITAVLVALVYNYFQVKH